MSFELSLNFRETDIIRACCRQESWAQQRLYEEFYSYLMGVCMRYASNRQEALDLLHDAFIKIFLNISQYQEGSSLSKWMYRVTVNVCIDHLRKYAKKSTEDIETIYFLSDADPGPLSQLRAKEILESVQSLSITYRAVFNLFVMEGYSHKEIGEMLGINESTSRANLVKARQKLKQILSKKSH